MYHRTPIKFKYYPVTQNFYNRLLFFSFFLLFFSYFLDNHLGHLLHFDTNDKLLTRKQAQMTYFASFTSNYVYKWLPVVS